MKNSKGHKRISGVFDWVDFFSKMLSVILGIVITFSVQGIINNKNERNEVKSALKLVRDEIVQNRQNLDEVAKILEREGTAAKYFKTHQEDLASCPEDSIIQYGSYIFTEMFVTLTDDAMQLLKSSSLFSKIRNNELSLEIIKAYDQAEASAQVFNVHEKYKMDLVKEVTSMSDVSYVSDDAAQSIVNMMQTDKGKYLVYALIPMTDPAQITYAIPVIDKSLMKVDAFLK